MIAVIRSEWLKLRTTAVPWVLGGIALLINALLILVIFLTRPDISGPGGAVPPGYTVPHTTQQLRNLVGSGFQGYLLALLLGTLIVTTEFRHKTVTTSFLVTPVRAKLSAAKLLTAAVLGAVLAVIMLVATMIGGGLTLAARGGSFSDMVHQIPAVAPGFILVFALFAVLGVGVGSVLTNQVAAIIVVPRAGSSSSRASWSAWSTAPSSGCPPGPPRPPPTSPGTGPTTSSCSPGGRAPC